MVLDLDAPEVKLPEYEIKFDGKILKFDAMLFGFRLRVLEGTQDPGIVRDLLQKLLSENNPEIRKLSTYEACLISADYAEFAEKTLSEPLKKVYAPAPSSTITTESAPQNLEH